MDIKEKSYPQLTVSGPFSYVLLENTGKYPKFPKNILIFGDWHQPSAEYVYDVSLSDLLLSLSNALYVVESPHKNIKKIGDVDLQQDPQKGRQIYMMDWEMEKLRKTKGEIMSVPVVLSEHKKDVINIDNRDDVAAFNFTCHVLNRPNVTAKTSLHASIERSYYYYNRLKDEISLFRPYKDLFNNAKRCPGKLSSYIFRVLLRCKKAETKLIPHIKKFIDSRYNLYNFIRLFYAHGKDPVAFRGKLPCYNGNIWHDEENKTWYTINNGKIVITNKNPDKKLTRGMSFRYVFIKLEKCVVLFDTMKGTVLSLGKSMSKIYPYDERIVYPDGEYGIVFIERNSRSFYVINHNGNIGPYFGDIKTMNCNKITKLYATVMDMAILSLLCNCPCNNLVMYIGAAHLARIVKDLEKLGMYKVSSYYKDNTGLLSVKINPETTKFLVKNMGFSYERLDKIKTESLLRNIQDMYGLISRLDPKQPDYSHQLDKMIQYLKYFLVNKKLLLSKKSDYYYTVAKAIVSYTSLLMKRSGEEKEKEKLKQILSALT